MNRILLIEDEANVASFISKGLGEQGYDVTVANDGESGFRAATQGDFNLIILDVILPGRNGMDICRDLRKAKGFGTPILMVTALGTTEQVVKGLETGADDYLTKPFKFQELLARVKVLQRRANAPAASNNELTYADVSVNLNTRKVYRDTKEVRLSNREFDLLVYMMRNPGRVLNRTEILQHVWEVNFDMGTNVTDVYVNYLRNKIDKEFGSRLIHTVVGKGYMLQSE